MNDPIDDSSLTDSSESALPRETFAEETAVSETEATTPVDFAQDEDVSRSFRRAVREALAGHALRGNKVAVWKDGRPVWVRPKAGGA